MNLEEFSEARRGIPQGSSVSPLVADVLLAPIFSILPDCGRVVNYADNFLIMARDVTDAEMMSLTLRGALKGHPAGPLQPTLKGVFSPEESINFLGYQFKPQHDAYLISPSPGNLKKFEFTFEEGLNKAGKSASLSKAKMQLHHLRRYVRSWTASFSLWDGAKPLRERKLTILDGFQAALIKSRVP